MRIATIISFATILLTPGAFAGESALPSRNPAGVKQVQMQNSNMPWLWVGVGALALGVARPLGGGSNGAAATSTGTP